MKSAVVILKSSEKKLLARLNQVVKKSKFQYRTFGTEIESSVTDMLISIFSSENLINTEKDYHLAENKNEFPDFTLLSVNPKLAIEIKSGNLSKKTKNKWVATKNSNNDMGTINKWYDKLKKFGGENIYYIFIIYNFNDKKEEIRSIQIDNFYKFLGVKDKILRYREKDGNLRPKDFYKEPLISSSADFEKFLSITDEYRSIRIIKKHAKKLSKDKLKEIFKELFKQ